MASSATHPPAGKFYDSDDNNDNDDDGSVSSGSSSDSDSDDEGEGIRPNASSKSSQEEAEDDEEVIKIRQKAFDLINKAGGVSEKERNSKQWPQNPKKLHYPVPQSQQQQQQAAAQSSGEMSFAGPYASPYQQSMAGQQQHHPANASAAHEAEQLSVTSLFLNCVSDLCKQSGKEIIQSGASILSSGYQSVSHYRDTPLQGSYDPIDTSQHGYGNSNGNNGGGGGMMRGRYRD
ncbi:MAG: hypothetical protein SGILL_002008 [Bacillariaceae sp.]